MGINGERIGGNGGKLREIGGIKRDPWGVKGRERSPKMGGGDNAGGGPKKIGGGRTGAVGEGAGFELAALRSRGHAPSAVATPLPRGHAPSAVATPPWRLSCRAGLWRRAVAWPSGPRRWI